MASTEIKKVVRIETGDGERTVKSLRAEINELRDALLNMEQGGDEWVATARQLTDAQNDLNSVMRAGKGDIDATSDSIVGMEQQYKSLYNTYKLLGEEARNSAEGIAMKDQLSELSANLNSAKQDAGNFKDNIGHYSEDIQKAFAEMGRSVKDLNDPFKMAGGGVQALGKSFKALIANPVGAVIMAIVVALKLLKNALDNSKEAQEALEDAMAAFKPIVDGVNKVLVELIKCYSDVAKAVGNFITKLFGVKDAADKAAASVRGLKDAQAELNAQEAKQKVYTEARERTIRDLREQLNLTTDMAKREAILSQIKHEQNLIDQDKIMLAKNQLNVAEAQQRAAEIDYENARARLEAHKDSKQAIEEEAKAYEALQGAIANTANAQASYNSAKDTGIQNTKKLDEEIGKANKGLKSAADEEKKQLDEILERLKNNSKTEVELLTEKYEKEKALLKKFHKDTTKLTEEYEDNLRKIQDQIQDNLRKSENSFKRLETESKERNAEIFKSLAYPSENYFKQIIPSLEENIGNAVKLYFDFLDNITEKTDTARKEIPEKFKEIFENGILRINRTGSIGTLLESFTGDTTSVKKALNVYAKDITYFIEDFNSKISGVDVKSFSDFPGILFKIQKELADTNKESKEYTHSIHLLERENSNLIDTLKSTDEVYAKLKESYKDDTILKRTEDAREKLKESYKNDAILEYQKQQYDAEEQALEDHLFDINERLRIFNEQKSDDEKQRLELVQEQIDAEIALQEYRFERIMDLREREIDINQELKDSWQDFGHSVADSIGTITNAISEKIKYDLQDEKITKQEAEKKKKTLKALEAVQLAASLATIAGNYAVGVMGVWQSYGAELAGNAQTAALAGPGFAAAKAALDAKSLATAIANTAGLTLTAGAAITAAITKTITNIKGLNKSDDSGGSATAVPQMIDSTPYSYTRALQTDVEREQELNKPIYVRVTDINDVQNRVRVVDEESSF